MFPEAKWLDALALPTKVTGGIAVACAILLTLDFFQLLPLAAFGSVAWHVVLTAGVIFGCLFCAALIDLAFRHNAASKKVRRADARRKAIKDEKEAAIQKSRDRVVKTLDYLSEDEIAYVADALRKNAQSFQTYVNSPPVTAMIGKGLVYTPGGPHHQDYYPFSFNDFVWEAILESREDFIAKDDAFKAAKQKRR
jgi:hypothetical protein